MVEAQRQTAKTRLKPPSFRGGFRGGFGRRIAN
jgi:hypothetical protein